MHTVQGHTGAHVTVANRCAWYIAITYKVLSIVYIQHIVVSSSMYVTPVHLGYHFGKLSQVWGLSVILVNMVVSYWCNWCRSNKDYALVCPIFCIQHIVRGHIIYILHVDNG